MSLPSCETLLLTQHQGVLSITLNRPQKRNAMNSQMVSELIDVFDHVRDDRQIRAIVLRGAQGNFCAGGDISGMNKEAVDDVQAKTNDASWHFNRGFGRLISKVNRAPQVVICLLEGAVLGGGFGLACVSDLGIANQNAKFAMPETGLGILPAQIAPFVVARIGITQARRLMLFGATITGAQAQQVGIVHTVTDSDAALDTELAKALKQLKRCAPNATAMTKKLMLDVAELAELEAILDRAADDFTQAINSPEGLEGTQAFIEKRKPAWAIDDSEVDA